jgi:hypothetical protein
VFVEFGFSESVVVIAIKIDAIASLQQRRRSFGSYLAHAGHIQWDFLLLVSIFFFLKHRALKHTFLLRESGLASSKMKLINTLTMSLEEFYGKAIPKYAILSHRWEDEEVLYQDMASTDRTKKRGWQKVQGCCKQALDDGWKYAWVDSCCIDKKSSAELSEAINSMFKWYSDAVVCYVYLSDVPPGKMARHTQSSKGVGSDEYFRTSEWFSRGWTLQELLAPQHLIFFDREWNDIGTRGSLRTSLIEITSIDCLDERRQFMNASVAQKISWASRRETTREEDVAYSLMGLLNINMPILYGEGKRAFMRLQEEILRTSQDESIFAWDTEGFQTRVLVGLLATSPYHFANCGNVKRKSLPGQFSGFSKSREPYALTNRGLRMDHLILRDLYDTNKSRKEPFRAILACAKDEWASAGRYQDYLTITIVVGSSNGTHVHAYRFRDTTSAAGSVNMGMIKPHQVTVKNLFFEDDSHSHWGSLFDSHIVATPQGHSCVVNFTNLVDQGYKLVEKWNRYGNNAPVLAQPLSSSPCFRLGCDAAAMFFKYGSSKSTSFAVILYMSQVLSAGIVEMTASQDKTYVNKLLYEATPPHEHMELGDRVSRKIRNGYIVFVSIKPVCTAGEVDWLVNVVIDTTTY